MEEIKAIGTEKDESEYGVGTVSIAFSRAFGLSSLWYKDQNKWVFNPLLLNKCQVFNWDFEGRHETCCYRKAWSRISWWIQNLNFFRIFGQSRFWLKQQIRQFFNWNGLPLVESFRLRLWGIKSWQKLWGSIWLENRDFSNLVTLFPHYRSVGILTQGTKPRIFQWDFLGEVDVLRLRSRWKYYTVCFWCLKTELQLRWVFWLSVFDT